MPIECFDETAFVAFADYCAAFLAAGFGLSLAFWLVGHAVAVLLRGIERGV